MSRTGTDDGRKVIARNKRALRDYHILDRYEAGLVLTGPEVKSIRAGKVSITEAFARVDRDEVWLHGAHVTPYDPAGPWNHDPTRPRKLLLHRREIDRLKSLVDLERVSIVPLRVYFRDGRVKVELGVGKGRKLHDKRHAVAERDAKREVERALAHRQRE